MFERGVHQAAGLWAVPLYASASLVALARPRWSTPGHEVLWRLAAQLEDKGATPLILDAAVHEGTQRDAAGLVHWLSGPSTAAVRPAAGGPGWVIVPAARGLRALQDTVATAGVRVALSRLLAPFDARIIVVLYASADELATLLHGLAMPVMVPVSPHPGERVGAYGAVKRLHLAGLRPVLLAAPPSMVDGEEDLADGHGGEVEAIQRCARRHLDLVVESWPVRYWGEWAREGAMTRTLCYDGDSGREGWVVGSHVEALHDGS